jgi:putative effector of murein hydrolase LrgA (UPF0299 family)
MGSIWDFMTEGYTFIIIMLAVGTPCSLLTCGLIVYLVVRALRRPEPKCPRRVN